MNQQPVTNKSANADRRVWTQTVFQAEHPSSGEDFIVILTRRTPKDGSTPDLSVRACHASGPRMGELVYIEPRSLKEWGDDTFSTITKLLADNGIVLKQCLKGLGKKGRKLYSWQALCNVVYEDMSGSSGKRRAVIHLRHRHVVDLELTFKGPWRAGDDSMVRSAMFADWNTKMHGFSQIEWDVEEDSMLAELGFNVTKS